VTGQRPFSAKPVTIQRTNNALRYFGLYFLAVRRESSAFGVRFLSSENKSLNGLHDVADTRIALRNSNPALNLRIAFRFPV
jgi:hypothetical protein